MADQAPHSPVYNQTEVVTDPEAPEAVQIPRGSNDGSDNGPHPLTEDTPNEVFGDEVPEQPSEPAHSVGADVPATPPPSQVEDEPEYPEHE
jgi:hypothetical protein